MSKQLISRALVILLVALLVCVALFKDYQIASEPGWPPNIKRYSNIFGRLRIKDTESDVTLFSYDSDPQVHPVHFEKIDANHWTVTFEKVRE
jgi:hypothetical protein